MPRLTLMPSLVLLAAIGICLPLEADAEYYRYETDNGSVAFTDDLEQIPARYRDSAVPLAEQSLHDWERTTRVEPGTAPKPAPQRLRNVTPHRSVAATEIVTIETGDDVDVDVAARTDEPIKVEKGILRSNGQGTTEYTIVRQGDRVLMEVSEPIVNWVEP